MVTYRYICRSGDFDSSKLDNVDKIAAITAEIEAHLQKNQDHMLDIVAVWSP